MTATPAHEVQPRPTIARWCAEMLAVFALALLWLSLAGLAAKLVPPRDLLVGGALLAAFVLIQIAPARRFGWRIAALLGWPGWRALAVWVAAAIAALAAELVWAAGHYMGQDTADDSIAPGRAILAVALFPVIEEMAFRGWLQQSGEKRLPAAVAMLIPTFLFAALHSSGDWLPRLDAGLLFGTALLATRSLWVPLAMHASVNLIAVLASTSAPVNETFAAIGRHPPIWLGPLAWTLNIAVAVTALAVAVVVTRRKGFSGQRRPVSLATAQP